MFFIPLSQIESVELVIHALKIASGEADCRQCPVRKVCMKQCLTIAKSVEAMISAGALPNIDQGDVVIDSTLQETKPDTGADPKSKSSAKPFLTVIK